MTKYILSIITLTIFLFAGVSLSAQKSASEVSKKPPVITKPRIPKILFPKPKNPCLLDLTKCSDNPATKKFICKTAKPSKSQKQLYDSCNKKPKNPI
jgi:hypothetical protein